MMMYLSVLKYIQNYHTGLLLVHLFCLLLCMIINIFLISSSDSLSPFCMFNGCNMEMNYFYSILPIYFHTSCTRFKNILLFSIFYSNSFFYFILFFNYSYFFFSICLTNFTSLALCFLIWYFLTYL